MKNSLIIVLIASFLALSASSCKNEHDAGAADPAKTWKENHAGQEVKTDAQAQDTTGINDSIGQSDG